jgi:3-methylfumaryl-CoA hydratase
MNVPNQDPWADWIGRTQVGLDVITAGQAAALCATLDREPSDALTPQGVHWLCAPPRARRSLLGVDGHPALGAFLPPVDLPHRMWASSQVDFLAPMAVGCRVNRLSTISSIKEKAGASGRLVFVDVEHLFSADDRPCVREIQTIVYREAPSGPAARPEIALAVEDWPWIARWPTDPILLFRYSALTFNGHRIHYDFPYATAVEGYAGLVVHGPLMATLMLDLCERKLGPNPLARFSFRGLSPAFCGETLIVAARRQGEQIELQVLTDGRRPVMTGQAVIRKEAA